MNEVQAMEELEMTSSEQFAGNDRFTWIPFYMEMAEKLLEYKDDRRELVKIVFGMDEQFVNYIRDDAGNNYYDLDPFSVFSIFNRRLVDEKRKVICTYFKDNFNLLSGLPRDFNAIPLMNPQKSVFVWREDIGTGIQPLWDLFSFALEDKIDDNLFSQKFDDVMKQKGIKWNITMALFWIRPYDFMPLDANSREYLSKIGIEVFEEKNLNARNYLNLIQKIKSKIMSNEIHEKSFPEISYNACRKDENSQGGPTMQGSDEKLNEYVDLLKSTKNLILTGAPGTGKTYLAKQIAEEMGCRPDEIGFVQFHPSYDYTDFVEGLRPVQDESGSGQIGFERKDGVFKEFCARALQNLVDSGKSVDVLQHERSINEIIADFLDGAIEKKTQFETITKNIFFVDSFNDKIIFVSIPQNEKVKNLQIQIDDILELISNNVQLNNGKAVSEYFKRKWRTQHDSYIFSLTKKIQESMENTGNNQTTAVKKIHQKNFVFIIDEINRGEVAKIFGELFYSIDPGYRVTAGDLEAMKAGKKGIVAIRTQYANLELTGNEFDRALGASDYGHFFVPENVYIIGTMNDIDRSVESMDFAFRRRFAWAEVEASHTEDMLDKLNEFRPDLAEEAKNCMKRLNDAISETQDFGPAYHIGASYFLKLNQYGGDFLKLNQYEGNFKRLWDYHIKGILEEYVRGHPNKTDLMKGFEEAYFLGKETRSEAEET